MKKMTAPMEKPIQRSPLRAKLGMFAYGTARKLLWITMYRRFAREQQKENFGCLQFSHRTPLLRKLRDVDMQYQYNKIINLKIAVKKLDGLLVRPGEVFSYWNRIGNPTDTEKRVCRGYGLKKRNIRTGCRRRIVSALQPHLLDDTAHTTHRYRTASARI